MQGLKDGQILRTISNVTYSESHYASDEEKLPLEVRACKLTSRQVEVPDRVPYFLSPCSGSKLTLELARTSTLC